MAVVVRCFHPSIFLSTFRCLPFVPMTTAIKDVLCFVRSVSVCLPLSAPADTFLLALKLLNRNNSATSKLVAAGIEKNDRTDMAVNLPESSFG